MKTAELLIYGDIGWEVTAAGVASDLKKIGAVDELHVRINSFGGDVYDGVAIHQRISEQKARVVVHVDGIAASAASVIAMAGKDILIAEAGAIMIHDAWVMAVGNATELRATADRAEAVSAQMASIYQRRTGQDLATIRAWMAEEHTFYADEAVAAGFATAVKEGERMAARYDPERHHFRKPPPAEFMVSEATAGAMRTVARMKMQLRRSA